MLIEHVHVYSTFSWKSWFESLTLGQRCPNLKHQVAVMT